MVSGVCELARAESEILIVRARSALIQLAVIATGLLVALISIGAILVAITWTLAFDLGWPAALAIVGTAGLILATLIIVALSSISRKLANGDTDVKHAEIRAQAASNQIKGEEDMNIQDPKNPRLESDPANANQKKDHKKPDPSLEERVINTILENPGLVAGGALTVFSLLGPSRTIRLLSRTTMLAGLVSSAISHTKDNEKADGSA